MKNKKRSTKTMLFLGTVLFFYEINRCVFLGWGKNRKYLR